MTVTIDRGICLQVIKANVINSVLDAVISEALDVRDEMPCWWEEQQGIGGGALEAIADQFVIDGHSIATDAALMAQLREMWDCGCGCQ